MSFKVHSFEWDESNLRHIEEHPIHPISSDQVEELFLSGRYKVRKSRLGRYLALGQNLDGRYLTVVFENKGSGRVRPVSARGMEDWEKRLFRRK